MGGGVKAVAHFFQPVTTMKKIIITEDCLVNGIHTPKGTVLSELSERAAVELAASGRASFVADDEETLVEAATVPEVPTLKGKGKGKSS